MKTTDKNDIIRLFENHFGEKHLEIQMLPPSGSYREYCRIRSENHISIGAFNADIRENQAFFVFTGHFLKKGLPVPEIYAISTDSKKYILEDLGDLTLFDLLTKERTSENFPDHVTGIYRKILAFLPKFQLAAGKDLDFSVCYPRAAFDKQSMMWDLNYFKYYFLKLARVPFDEQALEDDFQTFSDYLLTAGNSGFMFRDFQSRNVMLKNGEIYFIDYQGGRRGPLQYDLASLLYDGKADIPEEIRKVLYDCYLSELTRYIPVDTEKFTEHFNGFVLIRIMQAMGAYGFRGFYEKKEHFLKSIPYALKNLEYLLGNLNLPVKIPELLKVLEELAHDEHLKEIGREKKELWVRITSFSYKKGIPDDPSGNGGGFVFDCRAIPNPGKLPEYRNMTGKDTGVALYLEKYKETEIFLDAVKMLLNQSIYTYLERGFSHLAVNFGCTGGQHRSVYCAEKTAAYLKNNFPVHVVLIHREQE